MMNRVACVVMPRFPLACCLRAKPSLAGRPLAVVEGVERRQVVCASADAVGVEHGMTPKQARGACPNVVVVARDETAERATTSEFLDALETCSPEVEGAAPGVCFFDAGGLPGGEAHAVAAALSLAHSLGLSAAGAVADDKFTARCAATVAGAGISVVPRGGSAAFLAPLPVTLLPLSSGDAERFDILGLRTIGQIAALPTAPLAARFGERAREYALVARGRDDAPLVPRSQPIIYEERFAFDGAVEQHEPLFFALRGCLASVMERLAGSAQVCERVELILEMASGPSPKTISVVLAEPSASAQTAFDLARVAIEARGDLGGVEALIVRAGACGEPPPQMALFDGARSSRRAALAATIARLRASLGPADVVLAEPTVTRSRLPERMQRTITVTSPRQVEEGPSRPAGLADPTTLAPALRLVEPPKPIEQPTSGVRCAGPFRLSESWWERPIERDYYHVASAGELRLVFRDLRDGRWYLQGVFD